MTDDGLDGNHHRLNPHKVPSLNLQNLEVISALGRGAKGVVFLVKSENSEFLALKAISRASIEKNKKIDNGKHDDVSEYRRICFERDVLASLQHPLFPKLRGLISTEKIIGYAIDYCPGRDLNSLRKKQTEKMFSDDTIRFYAAELVLALEYLHGLGIVYRDLKPENVMIQENGHLMLVDFDLSTKLSPKTPLTRRVSRSYSSPDPINPGKKTKKKKRLGSSFTWLDKRIPEADSVHPVENEKESASQPDEKSNSFVGTEEYVAPEIILGNGHDFAVDLWCLGIMLHEMLYGITPFKGTNRKETFCRIINKVPELVGEPTSLRDLIRKLLEKDPKKRITVEEIKNHSFFKGVDWDRVLEIPRPPFIPAGEDTDGNKKIDVERFVQGVFKVDDDEKFDKDVGAEGICNPINVQNENFLVF